MFPEVGGPQTGTGFATSAINQQNTALLGSPQAQSTGMPLDNPAATNTTAPLSAGSNNMANMIQALRGGGGL